jgi:hypothetical protein
MGFEIIEYISVQREHVTGSRIHDVQLPVGAPPLDRAGVPAHGIRNGSPSDQAPAVAVVGGKENGRGAAPGMTEQAERSGRGEVLGQSPAYEGGDNAAQVRQVVRERCVSESLWFGKGLSVGSDSASREVEGHSRHAGTGESRREMRKEAPVFEALEAMANDYRGAALPSGARSHLTPEGGGVGALEFESDIPYSGHDVCFDLRA